MPGIFLHASEGANCGLFAAIIIICSVNFVYHNLRQKLFSHDFLEGVQFEICMLFLYKRPSFSEMFSFEAATPRSQTEGKTSYAMPFLQDKKRAWQRTCPSQMQMRQQSTIEVDKEAQYYL
jgi:hypothetical protein